MPHDRDGKELKVGDVINIPCRIKEIHLTEEFCNLNLETLQHLWPGTYPSAITLNSKQVVKE